MDKRKPSNTNYLHRCHRTRYERFGYAGGVLRPNDWWAIWPEPATYAEKEAVKAMEAAV